MNIRTAHDLPMLAADLLRWAENPRRVTESFG